MMMENTNVIAPKKKGNASWKPREDVQVKQDVNYRFRWVEANDDRIATLIEQGWELCSALNGERNYKGMNADKRIVDGKPLSTVVGNKDRVMMRLPVDGAKQRDEYFEAKAKRQVKAVRERANQETGVKTTGDFKVNGRVVNEITD
jgi:hypothetical protein